MSMLCVQAVLSCMCSAGRLEICMILMAFGALVTTTQKLALALRPSTAWPSLNSQQQQPHMLEDRGIFLCHQKQRRHALSLLCAVTAKGQLPTCSLIRLAVIDYDPAADTQLCLHVCDLPGSTRLKHWAPLIMLLLARSLEGRDVRDEGP